MAKAAKKKSNEEASNIFHNIMKASVTNTHSMNKVTIEERVITPGDKVYYSGREMTYQRPHIEKEGQIANKVYFSCKNEHSGENEEVLFKLSELTAKP